MDIALAIELGLRVYASLISWPENRQSIRRLADGSTS